MHYWVKHGLDKKHFFKNWIAFIFGQNLMKFFVLV